METKEEELVADGERDDDWVKDDRGRRGAWERDLT